jgi:phage gp29-like protein
MADQPGSYTASLMVHDGLVESAPDQVTIIAISTQTRLTETLSKAIAILNGFAPAMFKNSHMQSTLTKKIGQVIDQIQQGAYEEALQKLEQDILGKLDGCAVRTPPAPDPNDWIIDCGAQGQVYPLMIEAIGLLESLL